MAVYARPGQFKSVEEFHRYLEEVAPEIELDRVLEPDGPLASKRSLFGREISNRFAIHPMEGWDAEPTGEPSSFTKRRWRRFGRSGASLIWGGEAFAVTADGRANPNQLYRNPEIDVLGALASLRDEVRQGRLDTGEKLEDLVIGLQLTHSGRHSRPTSKGTSPLIPCHHPVLDARLGLTQQSSLVSDTELEEIAQAYVESAGFARDAGFDFVDIKCCHGYLLHELLGAKTRPGRYGGCFENRIRLVRTIVEEIRRTVPQIGIGVRISVADLPPFEKDDRGVGMPSLWPSGSEMEDYGFCVMGEEWEDSGLGEAIELIQGLMGLGVEAFSISLGSPYHCPHLTRPAAVPPSDGYAPPEDPLKTVARHLLAVRSIKKRFPDVTLVGSGYTYLQQFLPHVAQREVREGHVDFVGLGRMVLSYPEMPRDILAGKALARGKLCRTLSDCTTAPRNGLRSGCYPLDPFYRDQPEAQRLREIKKAQKR